VSTTARHDPVSLPDLARWSLIVGAIGLALTAVGYFVAGGRVFFSYLFAYNFVLAMALGAMAVWMIHNLTGGRWGTAIRRYVEAATRTLPVLVLLFVPVTLAVDSLYPWANPNLRETEHVREALERSPGKSWYLSVPGFLVRAAIYFSVWSLIVYVLNRWSADHDRTGDPVMSRRVRDFSGPGLILYGLAMTFASVDWIMSLDPSWFSTIFGVIVTVGQMVPALAFCIAAAVWSNTRRPPEERIDPWVWVDLGSLLLAFVMLWAYVSFSQLLLIWSGNLPEEISYYLARSEGGWQSVAVLLAAFYFAIPFLVLLARRNKYNTDRLLAVTSLIVVMSVVNQFWLVVPAYRQQLQIVQPELPPRLGISWVDFTAVVGLGGIWLATFVWQLQRRPQTPPRPLVEPEVAHHV
jgi:hypothetical protein